MLLTLYFLLLGFLAAHELDAVACHEWRLLYGLRSLPEAAGKSSFIALHVPLFAGLTWTAASTHPTASAARLGVALFALVHAGLHHRLRRSAAYAFHSPLSLTLIVGAALCGGVYVFMALLRSIALTTSP
jgi:hypothetical protein